MADYPDYPGDFVTFGPGANCTLDLCPIWTTVYNYRPSLAANLTFAILFGVALVAHAILGVWWRSWWFMWCIIVGCLDEMLGYAGRIWLHYDPWNFNAFMIQIVCLTIGPVFYCAAIYVVLARTITEFGPELSRFPPRLFYWIFIPCDIVSLILQGAGGGMSTTSSGTNQTGVDLALAGLAFQVFTLVVFSALYVDYLVRCWAAGRALGGGGAGRLQLRGRLGVFFGFMGLAIALTLARCAFRVDELSEGYDGALVHNEKLFIGLEGVLIIASVFSLCLGHPGLIFGREDRAAAGALSADDSRAESGLSGAEEKMRRES
ncbi:RTA1 like protein [Pleurostoma richardsiae]|uniref:RTA1 like protein n=1 Tax=Pleurostoma richardsiae TaxID=41990 RepID=A0AA38RZ09_9PEZI|nr:RTA1 like protein [Pleurostoma richardsiae]